MADLPPYPGTARWVKVFGIIAAVVAPSEMATAWASVEVVAAPEISFLALVQPDPNHVSPVTARVTGALIRIRAEHHARRGDTLAVIGQGSRVVGREVAVMGGHDGTWRPRRRYNSATIGTPSARRR